MNASFRTALWRNRGHHPGFRRLKTWILSVIAIGATVSCNQGTNPEENASGTMIAASIPELRLEDITAQTGLDFVHFNGMTGENYFVETVGSGVALFDMDNDGDLDIFLVQGNLLQDKEQSKSMADAIFAHDESRLRDELWRNELHETGKLAFTNVTDISGLGPDGYGMGVATGDVNRDGRVDLYVTQFGHNQLWLNCTTEDRVCFENATDTTGSDDSRWSTSASFSDVNADGWLDLYVANYVDFVIATHKPCKTAAGITNYCGPQSYEGEPDTLFINQGGHFKDVTVQSGITDSASSGLGVVAADFDRDGRPDWYVANDMRRNHLWHNESVGGQLRFSNTALLSGSAVAMDGRAQASMGLAAADFDNDGDDDLFMTHLSKDTNTFYVNDGTGRFTDGSTSTGLAFPSTFATGFGTAPLDLDNDGWLDLIAVNGEVRFVEEQLRSGNPYPLGQRNQVFYNTGAGQFVEVSSKVGVAFVHEEVSRGIAVGDLDNDGLADAIITNNSGPARILRNATQSENNWIGLRVTQEGVDAIGAEVTVILDENRRLIRRVATDGSYLSASDPRVLIGIGKSTRADVEVRLVDRTTRRWNNLDINTYHDLDFNRENL